jgi:predicted MFS family arabinose efflux permease
MTTLSIEKKPLGLSNARIILMAAACGFAVSTIYYNQPLLPQMAASFGRTNADAGLIATLTQLGYAAGLFLFVPLGDRVSRRWLILVLLTLNTLCLIGAAIAPSFAILLAASLAVGMTAVTAQVIIPAVSGLAAPAERGRVVGTLLSGLSAGLLLARTLSGTVGVHAGWRSMFVLAGVIDVVLMAIVWAVLAGDREQQPAVLSSVARLAWRLASQRAVPASRLHQRLPDVCSFLGHVGNAGSPAGKPAL